jgi:Glutaredoxin
LKQLVVYVRGDACPDIRRTLDFLDRHAVPHRLIETGADPAARQRVLDWTGYLSFPTLVVVEDGSVEPLEPPVPLSPGKSPRDVDRGTILTEASTPVLEAFLRRHGFL